MKASIVVVAVFILLQSPKAGAVVDPHPDQIGVYFDEDANTNSLVVSPMEPFIVYFIITRPIADIDSIVFGYRLEVPIGQEDLVFRLAEIWPGGPGTECFGNSCGGSDMFEDHYVFAFPNPLPTGVSVTVMRWYFLLLEEIPVEFYITAPYSYHPEYETPVYRSNGDQIPLGISSGSSEVPVARINGIAPVNLQLASFGALKALYR